jgi:type IV conjugative transfer system coupling protein TraD
MKKNDLDVFARGGDTWSNRINLFLVNVSRIALLSLIAAVLFFSVLFMVFTDAKTKSIYVAYNIANVYDLVYIKKKVSFSIEDKTFSLPPKVLKFELEEAYAQASRSVNLFYILSLVAFSILFFVLYKKLEAEGKEAVQDKFLRGQKFVTLEKLKELAGAQEKSILNFGGVDIPQSLLFRNFLCVGSMGSGKSQMVMNVLDSLRANGKKTIVYDVSGEFTEKYYREGKDVILNPMDERSARWTVLDDIVERTDLTMVAKAFIPDNPEAGANKFFVTAAQNLLEDLLEIGKKNGYDIAKVYKLLTTSSDEELAKLLFDNDCRSAADIAGGTNAAKSVRSEVSNSQALRYIDLFTSSKRDNFSIREWVDRGDDSWLFITSRATIHETIKPFVNIFISLCLAQAMIVKSNDLKVAFILDELDSAGKLESLNIALTQARKFGILTVVGAQSISQFTKIYGKDTMQTFIGNLQHKLILRVEEDESQEKLSNILGKTEQEEMKLSSSHGVESSRDSNSISSDRKDKSVVHSSEIGSLNDLEGFLKIAGSFPVAKVKYEYVSRPSVAVDFSPRSDLVIQQKKSDAVDFFTIGNEAIDAGDDGKESFDSGAEKTQAQTEKFREKGKDNSQELDVW